MKILVPIDFSPVSLTAMNYAAMLAKTFDADILLFHAIPRHSVWIEDLDEELIKESEKELKELGENLQQQGLATSKITTMVVHYFPLNTVINDIVLKEKINYIVMGTNGASGLKKVFLGSFTAGLIAISKVPVIAVPGNTKPLAPTQVVYATDMVDMESEMLVLINFIRHFGAWVHMVNISADTRPMDEKHQLEQLKKITNYENITFTILPGKDIEALINCFALERKADLLAMFTRNRSFFKRLFTSSCTEEIAFYLKLPLFVFKKSTF